MEKQVKIQHKKALYQLYKQFEQDIDNNDEIIINKRGYEIVINNDGNKEIYRVVMYIEKV